MKRFFRTGCLVGILAAAVVTGGEAQTLQQALDESYPTNLTLLTGAAESAVAELFLNFPAEPGATLLLESESDHEAQWFIQNLLLNRLTAMGYTVYLKDVEPASDRSGLGDRQPAEPVLPQRNLAEAMRSFRADSAGAVADSVDLPASGDSLAARISSGADSGDVAPPAPPATDYVLRFRVVECGVTYPRSYRKSPLGSRMVQRMALVHVFGTLVAGEQESVAWVGRGDAERLDVVPAGKLSVLEGGAYPFTAPTLNVRSLSSYGEPLLVTLIILGLIFLFYNNQD